MSEQKRIRLLLVDNSADYRRSLRASLEREGYTVLDASSLDEARQILEREQIDLVLTELRLLDEANSNDWSGLEIARLSSERNIACIILTAFPSVEIARLALRSQGGEPFARDLIAKSAGPEAVLEAIGAILRHPGSPSADADPASLHIDTNRQLVFKDEKLLKLSRNEYKLLEALHQKGGDVVSTWELIRSIYLHGEEPGQDSVSYDTRLRNLVDRTKEKIEEPDSGREFLQVVVGRGYRLNPSFANAVPGSEVPPPPPTGEAKTISEAEPDDEEVYFTALHPRQGPAGTWLNLLVYIHSQAGLEQVREDAARSAEQIPDAKEVSAQASSRLPRGTEITIVPACEGVTFNPSRVSLQWMEEYQRAAFRFRADPAMQGDAARGQITFYIGPLIVGTLKFAMLFEASGADVVLDNHEQGRMYHQDKIFISYSHKDTDFVATFRKVHKATGYDVLIDRGGLRPGEEWNPALMDMIDRADIFQLFWSENSSHSDYCKQEWEHALKRNREGFIRPIYWQRPMPAAPGELSKYHFEYVEL